MTYLLLAAAALLVVLDCPSWLALMLGISIALASPRPMPAFVKPWTSRLLQLGVVALGAGMNLITVMQVGASGIAYTLLGLTAALALGALLGRALRVPPDTSLLVSVGTAICGGSAIAAITSVIKPKPEETSISLAVVFILNAIGLLLFPALGHALDMSEPHFGRWAALAIHDTSSVVGAGLRYGPVALDVATTTKLARALWIVPLTLAIAWRRRATSQGGLDKVKWPWFIAGFLVAAALFTWIPMLSPMKASVVFVAKRLLVLALFFIGLSLSRAALRTVGWRPLAQGVSLWILVAALSWPLAR